MHPGPRKGKAIVATGNIKKRISKAVDKEISRGLNRLKIDAVKRVYDKVAKGIRRMK